ncbi:MAG: hypothetical protein RR405_03790, partial [Clostridia bacterium]
MKENEVKIKNYLLRLGFQPNLKGYQLLSRLLSIASSGKQILPLKYEGYKMLSNEFSIDTD